MNYQEQLALLIKQYGGSNLLHRLLDKAYQDGGVAGFMNQLLEAVEEGA